MPHRLVLSIATLGLALTACGDNGSKSSSANKAANESSANNTASDLPGVRVVTPADANKLLADGSRTLIDIRTPEEYAEGHLAGSQLIDFKAADFEDRLKELDRNAQYVIYCRSGNRSGQARTLMTSLGFTDVADIDGGIQAWANAGLPVEQ